MLSTLFNAALFFCRVSTHIFAISRQTPFAHSCTPTTISENYLFFTQRINSAALIQKNELHLTEIRQSCCHENKQKPYWQYCVSENAQKSFLCIKILIKIICS